MTDINDVEERPNLGGMILILRRIRIMISRSCRLNVRNLGGRRTTELRRYVSPSSSIKARIRIVAKRWLAITQNGDRETNERSDVCKELDRTRAVKSLSPAGHWPSWNLFCSP